MTKVLVVDDQRIVREYMENVVCESENYELAGSLSSAEMASVVCSRRNVDLILMDVCTQGAKDGIAVAAELREQYPQMKIIVVTSMPEESFLRRAREAGADSFWHKESSPEKLISVMDATMEGEHIWPGELPAVQLGLASSADLTATEIRILRLICEGLGYSELAVKLNYTKDNVKYHIRNILRKTGYENKTQLAIAVTGKRFIIPRLLDEQEAVKENPLVL